MNCFTRSGDFPSALPPASSPYTVTFEAPIATCAVRRYVRKEAELWECLNEARQTMGPQAYVEWYRTLNLPHGGPGAPAKPGIREVKAVSRSWVETVDRRNEAQQILEGETSATAWLTSPAHRGETTSCVPLQPAARSPSAKCIVRWLAGLCLPKPRLGSRRAISFNPTPGFGKSPRRLAAARKRPHGRKPLGDRVE